MTPRDRQPRYAPAVRARPPKPSPLEVRLRRRLAILRFYMSGLRVLVGPMMSLGVVFLVGAALHRAYGAPVGGLAPSWSDAFFNSYALLFMEHIGALPAHPIGQAVQYVQPILGVFLLAEGVVKLALRNVRRGNNNPRWVETMAKSSRGHIIVCGAGTVGFRIIEELSAHGEQVFVIERNGDNPFVERARELGVEVLIGDALADHTLRALNVAGARAVIIATDDDLANLEIAMDVREMAADVPIVMRLFDQRLAKKVRTSLGVEVSLSTSQIAAPLFASAALDTRVINTHRVGDALLLTLDVLVKAGGKLDGATVAGLAQDHGLSVLALCLPGEGWETQPAPLTRLSAGAKTQIVVRSERLELIDQLNNPPQVR